MELVYLSIAILASFAIDSGGAIQCYQCEGQMMLPAMQGMPPNDPVCQDPFDAEAAGTQLVECDGKCSANSTSTMSMGMSITIVQRGCMDPADCQVSSCFNVTGGPPGGAPGGAPGGPPESESSVPPGIGAGGPSGAPPASGRLCTYCCDGELCNSMGLEETAASADTVSCWTCNEKLADKTAGSCASDDFKGTGAIALPCAAGTMCMAVQMPDEEGDAALMRGCDPSGGQLCGQPGASCCQGNLCNVGSDVEIEDGDDDPNAPDGGDDDDDDDDKEGTIQCLRCESAVSANDTDMQTACEMGTLSSDTVTKIDCPSGKCITYTTIGPEEPVFSRDCVTPMMDNLGYCEASDSQIKAAECCTKNLCNKSGAAAVATSVVAITSAFLISLCLTFL